MEATTAPRESWWTFAQWALVVLATLQLVWATAGLIAEPSIDFGDDAVTRNVLGVDFNGVHAISGYLLFLPAYYFALRPRWALYYCVYVAGALWATGVWALFDNQPAYVFTFPNNHADAYFHMATATLFTFVAIVQVALDRRVPG